MRPNIEAERPQRTTLFLDGAVVDYLRNVHNINISLVCRNHLTQLSKTLSAGDITTTAGSWSRGYDIALTWRGKYNLKPFFEKMTPEFMRWLKKKKKIKDETINTYIRAVNTHLPDDITTPIELEEYLLKHPHDKVSRGLKNFFSFLLDREVGGQDWAKWHKRVLIQRSTPSQQFITDEVVRQGLHDTPERYKALFSLLAHSGQRLSTTLQTMLEFDALKSVAVGWGVSRYPVASASAGTKRAFWMYYPTDLEPAMLSLRDTLVRDYARYSTFESFARSMPHYIGTSTTKGKRSTRASAKMLRKWQYNFLLSHGVPDNVADFVQGRASTTIGSAHYLNATQQADAQMRIASPKITSELDLSTG